MKVCTKCGQQKELTAFTKNSQTKDGLRPSCKSCAKLHSQKYYKLNVEKIRQTCAQYRKENSDKIKEYHRIRHINNKEQIATQIKEYRKLNPDKIKECNKKYRNLNKDKIRKYYANRRKIDPIYKITHTIRTLIRNSFKRKTTNFYKQSKTEVLLGCTIPELRDHLQKQFKEGMTFENHGQWHIDHIIPLSSAKTQEDIEKLCHYTNLQPLWAEDNIKKRDKY